MIKSFVKRLLKSCGYQICKVPRPRSERQPKSRSERQSAADAGRETLLHKIAADPLNSILHLQLSLAASEAGNPFLAYAELKTAEWLGAERDQVEEHRIAFRAALPDLMEMNHNRYFRFRTLADEVLSQKHQSGLSILDVGGGHGELAAFLPEHFKYCLVEPTQNGISGTALPFSDHSFDYVVSCHVLEHIPMDERGHFLDQLLSKAKRGFILLNPFHVEGTHVVDRLKLFVEIMDAQWAKEHLDCKLPSVDDVVSYAKERELEICVKPNGTLTTSMAFVFVDHFAAKSGSQTDWRKVNTFFNEKYTDILDSDDFPTAYLIHLGWPEERIEATDKVRLR